MLDKISIIIPVYNVESYIKECLDSVIAQSYKNLEIICIDDGSTDSSGIICDEYAKNDKRIKVYHKNNGGVSSAKNIGLENCTGRYIGFVDSDDWIEPNMYEVLHEAIKDKNVAVSVVSYFKDTADLSIPIFNRITIDYDVISPKDMLLYPLKRDDYMGFCGYLWNKLFDVDVIRNNNLKFDEKVNYGEDILFYTNLIIEGKCKGKYLDEPLYHYRQRDTSISKSKKASVKLDILTVYKKVEELFVSNGNSDISFWVRGFYCYHASVIAEIAIENKDKKTLTLMQDEIRLHLVDYIKTNKDYPEKFERMNCLIGE
jgi:glycosyltransferase involved in cell wall biosynthesis